MRSSRSTSETGSFAAGGFVHPAQPLALVWQPAKVNADAIAIHAVHFIVDPFPFDEGVHIRLELRDTLSLAPFSLAIKVDRAGRDDRAQCCRRPDLQPVEH